MPETYSLAHSQVSSRVDLVIVVVCSGVGDPPRESHALLGLVIVQLEDFTARVGAAAVWLSLGPLGANWEQGSFTVGFTVGFTVNSTSILVCLCQTPGCGRLRQAVGLQYPSLSTYRVLALSTEYQ